MAEAQELPPLVELGSALRDGGYHFVTPTPATHERVRARAERLAMAEGRPLLARNLRDVFGWNLPFRRTLLPPGMLAACDTAGVLGPATAAGAEQPDEIVRSQVRFATVDGPGGRLMFVHSAFPTTDRHAVFFGPDSYRFAAALTRTVWKARRLIDVGCGTGVGGLLLAPRAEQVVLADVSPRALELARVNVALNPGGGAISVCQSDVLGQIEGDFDVVIANPPYLADASPGHAGRLYRDGGGPLGLDLSVRIVTESLARLRAAAGGQLVLYTGVPIIEGQNVLADRVEAVLREQATRWRWEELDPDVFGEELDRPPYRDAERLAVVLLVAEID